MKSFSNATKAGLIIMLIAGIIMALLVVVSFLTIVKWKY